MSLPKQTDNKFRRRLLKQSVQTCIDHKHNYTKIISEFQNVIQPFRTDTYVYSVTIAIEVTQKRRKYAHDKTGDKKCGNRFTFETSSSLLQEMAKVMHEMKWTCISEMDLWLGLYITHIICYDIQSLI
ncbi:hypothetical protein WN51_11175 [Melipona quadrifasciata]|uniref:Uncharacterized protein n=1 Tax=Melipona quadrifasciata TaxID=166423 RepID=A0A0N0BHZ9_9HYME|nr:hypothetical protein WN51_11175 [Melipona quadrifasciata]